jgi:hypothetical protein
MSTSAAQSGRDEVAVSSGRRTLAVVIRRLFLEDRMNDHRRPVRLSHHLLALVFLTLGCSALQPHASAMVQDDSLPGNAAMQALGRFVGEWRMEGITTEGRAAIPGGQGFSARQSVKWIDAGRSLGISWTVTMDDGAEVSMGRSRIGLDEMAGAVLNVYSGREGGRPFTGSATMIAFDGVAFDWRGHETSGSGASVNYEVTYLTSTTDAWVVDFIPTCIDGTAGPVPGRFTWERVNPFTERLGMATELMGDWTGTFQDHQGRTVVSTMEITPGPGTRSLRMQVTDEVDGVRTLVGDENVWFDAAAETIQSSYFGADGIVVTGTMTLVDRDGRSVLRDDWSGSDEFGTPRSGVSWMEIDGDRLVISFTEIIIDGKPLDADACAGWTMEYDRRN